MVVENPAKREPREQAWYETAGAPRRWRGGRATSYRLAQWKSGWGGLWADDAKRHEREGEPGTYEGAVLGVREPA